MVTSTLAACHEGVGSLLTLLFLLGALMGAQLEGAGVCQDLVLGVQSLLSMPLLTGRERTVKYPWLPDVERNLPGHAGSVSPFSK